MRSFGLKVLKNKLSEYVRLAAGGETVLVIDRDRMVAEIVPPQPGCSSLLMDALMAEAVGWLTARWQRPPPQKPVMALRDLVQDLQQDREDQSTSIARSSPWLLARQSYQGFAPDRLSRCVLALLLAEL